MQKPRGLLCVSGRCSVHVVSLHQTSSKWPMSVVAETCRRRDYVLRAACECIHVLKRAG